MISCYNSEVVVDSDNASSIELNTRSHTHDDDQSVIWFCERRKRITSSNAKSVAKQKSTTPVARLVNQLLYSTFRGNSATRWGLQQEEHSVSIYTTWLHNRGSPTPTVDTKCGLVVCTAHPWLAATPDGWVSDPAASPSQGLIELKNPYSYRDLAVSDAVVNKKCDCLTINNGSVELKRTHSYYYQIQIAMFCTRTKWCDFFLRTTVDFHCERVPFDESFCSSILPILRRFYILAILPELTLKSKPIREPKDWVAEETVFLQEMTEFVT